MENEKVLELSDESYVSFMEECDSIVFIDFYSNTCQPCQTLLSFLPNLASHFKDEKVVVAKVNVAHNPKLSAKFMVRSVPLTIVIGRDKMVKRAETGLLDADAYLTMINKELGKTKGFFSKFFK
jgi:thioredoxin 1